MQPASHLVDRPENIPETPRIYLMNVLRTLTYSMHCNGNRGSPGAWIPQSCESTEDKASLVVAYIGVLPRGDVAQLIVKGRRTLL